MGTLKSKEERLAKWIKIRLTEEEYAQIDRYCEKQKLQIGPGVRAILNDYLSTRLSRGETAVLEAVEELRANYLGVIQLQIEKQFSPATFNERLKADRLRRHDLAQEFLLAVPEQETIQDDDDEDGEEYDEEED